MWNEVWGSHIVTADAQTQKHNYWGCVSLQRVSYSAAYVCVCVCASCLTIFGNGLWHAEGQRTQHWIILIAPHITFSCFLFFFFRHVTRHFLPPEGCARLPVIVALRFLRHRSESGRMMWRRKREGEGELLIFFESECGSIICFLEGVVQKQPAGEPCLLYLIGTESVTPWLKKPQWKHSAHTNTHTLSFHVCFENPLFLFTSFTHLVEST